MFTKTEIELFQNEWGDSLIEIGKAFIQKNDYTSLAKVHVEKFYGYQEGKVIFKPTLASKYQFRLNEASALSYFIGKNPDFPYDTGFALKPWAKVVFENAGLILKNEYAMAMGNYFFTDYKNNTVKVEYSFGYFRNEMGKLKINLHHSSIPYKRKNQNS